MLLRMASPRVTRRYRRVDDVDLGLWPLAAGSAPSTRRSELRAYSLICYVTAEFPENASGASRQDTRVQRSAGRS
jgi:hypothetical protein